MPFNPFSNLTGRHACTLFEIRLDDDFIIFRGNEQEAAGQLLRGTIVLCLPSPLKVDDIHLRLTGQFRLAWTYTKATPSGIISQKVDRTKIIFNHRWSPFVPPSSKSVTLEAGNYEWPFELLLPGSTAESVEGLPETSLTYKLKATIARGKLACDVHAYKHLRIIRTLEPAALEFLHAMSVENVWVNKVEYSIVIPQKAVVFGGKVPLDMRFTPLLKGLEMGDITVKLVEIQEFILQGPYGQSLKERRHEREVKQWVLKVNNEEHWQDLLDETGQEGWVVNTPLALPKTLRECLQDVDMDGIKIKHKLRLNVALRNPDGHVSELRATLPITIFISPNMLLDDQGNIIGQQPGVVSPAVDVASAAPPGYGEHILDQLYDNVPTTGFQSPSLQSGLNSPFYSQSRAGSVDNLSSLSGGMYNGVAPAALSSRLQNVAAVDGNNSMTATASHAHAPPHAHAHPLSQSNINSSTEPSPRRSNEEQDPNELNSNNSTARSSMRSGHYTPEHIDFPRMHDLSRVPSYATAVRTSPRNLHLSNHRAPPDYGAAVSMSAPASPTHADSSDPLSTPPTPGMETIHEAASTHSAEGWTARRRRRNSGSSGRSGGSNTTTSAGGGGGAAATAGSSCPITARLRSRSAHNSSPGGSPRFDFISRGGIRATSLGLGFLHTHLHIPDSDERGRLHLIQARERVM